MILRQCETDPVAPTIVEVVPHAKMRGKKSRIAKGSRVAATRGAVHNGLDAAQKDEWPCDWRRDVVSEGAAR